MQEDVSSGGCLEDEDFGSEVEGIDGVEVEEPARRARDGAPRPRRRSSAGARVRLRPLRLSSARGALRETLVRRHAPEECAAQGSRAAREALLGRVPFEEVGGLFEVGLTAEEAVQELGLAKGHGGAEQPADKKGPLERQAGQAEEDEGGRARLPRADGPPRAERSRHRQTVSS
ncbi:unnamed protein product, partial [Prorocentrum cordatum]